MFKLTPVLKDYLWGGEKLKTMFGRKKDGIVAESWEFSVHRDGESRLADGGTFSGYLAEHPTATGPAGAGFPVLIKYIDAAQKLSVQVHPDDAYAKEKEHDNGKTEMWYVLSADPGAGIYCGFERDTGKEEFLQKVQDGTVEELLHFIPVRAGDCYLIEAGTVHAIGAGCVILEVQQSSNVTYRVYDYNRRGADGKLRPLHVNKAVDVMRFGAFRDETHRGEPVTVPGGKLRKLTACRYFTCSELRLAGEFSAQDKNSFTAVSVVSGSGTINGETFAPGDSFFVPCGEKYTLKGNATVVLTTKGNPTCFGGIDLGGTAVKCGIADAEGRLIVKGQRPTGKEAGAAAVISEMAGLLRELEEKSGVRVTAAGVGCPGLIDTKNGTVVYSNNLMWQKVPLAETLQTALGVPVFVTNDANAAALGEFVCGAGAQYHSMVMLTLGTGVGSGIVLDGKLFEGNRGAGVELGHEVIRSGGVRCTCGRRGCLEAYASATALIRQARHAMEKAPESRLWQLAGGTVDGVTGKTVFDALRAGDPTAKKTVQKYTDYLADGVANAINAFHPEAIVLGGGICAAGDLFLPELRRKVSRRIFGGARFAPVKLTIATLGNDAGFFGAAALAAEKTKGKKTV